jgi:hypothetical protein
MGEEDLDLQGSCGATFSFEWFQILMFKDLHGPLPFFAA